MSAVAESQIIAGPVHIEKGFWSALNTLRKLVDNPMTSWPEEIYTNPIVVSRMLGQNTIFVCDPALVQQVLVDDADSFVKAESMRRSLEPMLGQAILTSEGTRWRSQRRVAAPVFRPSHVNNMVPAMIAAAEALAAKWRDLPEGTTLEMTQEMMGLTFEIILVTMLSGQGDADPALFDLSMRDSLNSTSWEYALSALGAPMWTPYPGRTKARRANDYLRATLSRSITERRRTGERHNDLLSLMLDAKDPETGSAGLGDDDIRDNLLTFVAAGHETTALALTWTFFLLARHPEVEHRVLAEIEQVTDGGALKSAHVASLVYTRQVVQEAMRIYPPVAMAVRQTTRVLEIGGIRVTPEDNVFVPIYAIHRQPSLWQEPDRFDPDRFTTVAVKARHRWSYLPFAAGPRICIGMGFALLEAAAILGVLLPRVRLSAAAGMQPLPRMKLTTRPANGMPLSVNRRAPNPRLPNASDAERNG